jgi:hypothetical protein
MNWISFNSDTGEDFMACPLFTAFSHTFAGRSSTDLFLRYNLSFQY